MPQKSSDTRMHIPAPLSVELHPTNRCNVKCTFCRGNDDRQEFIELPDERWLEIADEICALGVTNVTITGGGEPLLRATLVLRLMGRFAKAGIEGDLLTNGVLVTPRFAERIVEMGWRSVQFSIHAPTAALHDTLAGKAGAFSLAMGGLRSINDFKRLRKSPFPRILLRFAVTASNISTLPRYVALAKSVGAETIAVVKVNDVKGADGTYCLSGKAKRDFEERMRRSTDLAKSTGIDLVWNSAAWSGESASRGNPRQGERNARPNPSTDWKSIGEDPCPNLFNELVIFADGTAAPCPHFSDIPLEGGTHIPEWLEDVTHQSLTEVWQKGFPSLRQAFLSGKLCRPCKKCSMRGTYQGRHWPEPLFYQKFEHLKKRKLYNVGTAFGEEQLKAYPDSPALHHYLGEFHMELGEYETAIRYLSRAVELDGKLEWTRFSLGKCYYLLGRYAEAEDAFRKNLEETSNQECHFHSTLFLAMVAEARGDRSGCEEALKSLTGFRSLFGKVTSVERGFLGPVRK